MHNTYDENTYTHAGSDMEASAEDIAEAEAIMRATNGDM